MAKPKKTIVATGRVGNPELKSLDQIEAERRFTRFGSQTKEEYGNRLERMTTFDLSNHAVDMGIRPGSERSRIRQALLTAFEHAKASAVIAPARTSIEATSFNNNPTDNYETFMATFRASKEAVA